MARYTPCCATLRIITPDRSRGRNTKPVVLPHLGIAAQPLYGLDYLIAEAVDAAIIGGSGIRVNVPTPGRFTFHNLWVAATRPASETAKSRKDIRQAVQLLDVLTTDRPHNVTSAYKVLLVRPRMLRVVTAQLKLVDPLLVKRLTPLLRNGRA